jgi:hypothetical protein
VLPSACFLVVLAAAALSSAAFGQPPGTPPGDADARELVRRCALAHRWADRAEMRVVTDERLPSEPREMRDELWYRRDNDRLDVSGTVRCADKPQYQSYGFRRVIADNLCVSYSYELSAPNAPRSGMATTKTASEYLRFAIGCLRLDGLTGFTGGQFLADAMLASPIRHSGSEAVDGVACEVLEAVTKYGTIRLWIAPGRACAAMKYVLTKGPDDIYDDMPLRQQPKFHVWDKSEYRSHWEMVCDRMTLSHIGDSYIPTTGRWVAELTLSGGTRRTEELLYKRTDIKLNPSFEGTDAFKIDLPENARINNLDDPKSGVVYVWKGGRVVPGYAVPQMETAAEWETHSTPTLVFWVAGILAALCATGALVVVSRRRRVSR